ncbi:unnamed protein product, partial [Mycena citricolor]
VVDISSLKVSLPKTGNFPAAAQRDWRRRKGYVVDIWSCVRVRTCPLSAWYAILCSHIQGLGDNVAYRLSLKTFSNPYLHSHRADGSSFLRPPGTDGPALTPIIALDLSTMNAINRYELYVLEDGEKLLDVAEDTKIPNAATFTILKEDHTLANMLRAQLLSEPSVLFAGYKVAHPLTPQFIIKIQTDGTVTPQTVMENACTKLIATISSLEAKFKREFSLKEGESHAGVTIEDPYGSSTVTGWGGSNRREYMDF